MQDMRTTTGQRVSISYDPSTNALIFREEDWFAEPIRSTGVPAKSAIMRRLGADNVTRLVIRRKGRRAAARAV
ncbi:MAG: hypothetical protein Q8L54_06555 [Devosia sp.]|nr:hypothetical protein [Devosia sp.]